jgi:hypothetical protein
MKIRSSGLRLTKLVPGMCLALALVPSFVSIALGRGAPSSRTMLDIRILLLH